MQLYISRKVHNEVIRLKEQDSTLSEYHIEGRRMLDHQPAKATATYMARLVIE